MKTLFDILFALGTGAIVGAVFTLLKFPLPAPNAWAGIAGIAGILLGSLIVKYLVKGY